MGLPASFPDSSPRRFDPAFQFLHKQVCVSHALGRIHRITAVSSLFPAASLASLKRAASLQTRSQSSFSLVSRWDFLQRCCARRGCRMHVAGEATPDTVFFLGRGFCPVFFCLDMAALKDADAVGISMKFPCEAVVSMDVSQHCTDSCDQDVSQHCADSCDQDVSQHCADSCDQDVSQHCADSCDQRLEWLPGGWVPRRAADGESESLGHYWAGHVPVPRLPDQASCYQDSYRELFRHFVRTLKGKEPPEITKEQFLRAFWVAVAAEQSWWNRSAVDLPCESAEGSVVKTEAP
ncbi:uncharacterized protein LOC129008520 isoform X1 [Pongo pygmaeus]|uniref:uncharacterized protein LOC129008520 isoform X1 n=1 Tax=Pongo pygmaeus TaxID=9600 RepID=UPI00300D2DB9